MPPDTAADPGDDVVATPEFDLCHICDVGLGERKVEPDAKQPEQVLGVTPCC
jgi:hypothetical protein